VRNRGSPSARQRTAHDCDSDDGGAAVRRIRRPRKRASSESDSARPEVKRAHH
jgi:hypothetical protein